MSFWSSLGNKESRIGFIWHPMLFEDEIGHPSDEHQYCSKNVATPGATNFTLSTRGSYKLGGDSVVYTSKSDGSTFCHSPASERPLGFSTQTSMDSKEDWLLMKEREIYSTRNLVYCK